MLLFDFFVSASEFHTSLMDSGNIRLELKLRKALPDSITWLLYLELLQFYLYKLSQTSRRTFKRMETVEILCTLQDVKSFLGVFPSDLLPYSIALSRTVINNADPHTEKGSHWLAIHFETKASSAYYFDSYGISPLVPTINAFLRRKCTVWV
jgi:hypothetical protein